MRQAQNREKGYQNLLEDESTKKIIESLCDLIDKRKVVIYGIGERGEELYHGIQFLVPEIEIVAFCDELYSGRSPQKEVPLISVEELTTNYKECVVLVTSRECQKIKDRIMFCGGKEENIILCDEIPIFFTISMIVRHELYVCSGIEFRGNGCK